MTDSLKVLGQLDPSATTTTTLYTVPDLTQTTISSIVAANRTGSAITFRLSVHVAGAGADDKQYLYYDKSVAANDSLTIVRIFSSLLPGDNMAILSIKFLSSLTLPGQL